MILRWVPMKEIDWEIEMAILMATWSVILKDFSMATWTVI